MSILQDARAMRAFIELAAQSLDDAESLQAVCLHPHWAAGKAYAAGYKVQHGGALYRCLQGHMAQADWTPDAAPSLWAKVLTDPSGTILPWEQPGSTNPYMNGDKVTHNGKTWESLVDNNVWEPGAVGTESLWKEVAA